MTNSHLCETLMLKRLRLTKQILVKSISLTTALLFGFISLNSAQAAGDLKRGEALSQTCLGCHGAPGLRNPGPVYAIPMVGGQHAEYIVTALKAYKSKERSHKTMQAQAASLSEQDMIDIAEFFSSLAGNSRPSHVNAQLRALGKEKAAVCASCHGATGDGELNTFPKLAGQYESYIVHSLKDYRSGERNNAVMKGFAGNLTIGDIEALAAWFASQEGGLSAPESKIFKAK